MRQTAFEQKDEEQDHEVVERALLSRKWLSWMQQ